MVEFAIHYSKKIKTKHINILTW